MNMYLIIIGKGMLTKNQTYDWETKALIEPCCMFPKVTWNMRCLFFLPQE